MTPDELREALSEVQQALAFLNIVVQNNPNRPLVEIERRPDVREALAVVRGWLRDAASVVESLPGADDPDLPDMTPDKRAFTTTLTKMNRDLDLKIWTDPKSTETLLVRMGWFLSVLAFPFTLFAAIFQNRYRRKTWISRLTPNTCKYCRALHGITIPVGDSFAPFARAVGWTRIYGSLQGPPLHPSCACRTVWS